MTRPTKPQIAALRYVKDKGTLCTGPDRENNEVHPRTLTVCIKRGWLYCIHTDATCSLWELTKEGQKVLAP